MAVLRWLKDNSMLLTVTLSDASGPLAGADVVATLVDSSGQEVWSGELGEDGGGVYSAIIDPADAQVTQGRRYVLRTEATHSGHALMADDEVVVVPRRIGDTDGVTP